MMFSWAKKEYLLDNMSIEQVLYYHEIGWNARQTEAMVYWGMLGQLLNGEDPQKDHTGEFRKSHPDGVSKDGAWKVSR